MARTTRNARLADLILFKPPSGGGLAPTPEQKHDLGGDLGGSSSSGSLRISAHSESRFYRQHKITSHRRNLSSRPWAAKCVSIW
jgi:hypothetical protein